MERYDFSGWATRANVRCSDGRTILKDAFKHNDGKKVPLVWAHQHNDPNQVLGYAILEHRDGGMYAYGTFNDTESGKTAKLLVEHGDVNSLSIYANNLKEHMSVVKHGNIRELSLVLAGANPEAFIENVIKHGEECGDEAEIFTGDLIELYHAEESDEDETLQHEEESKTDDSLQHAEESGKEEKEDMAGKSIKDIFDTLTEEQQDAVHYMLGKALEYNGDDEEGGDEEMKHNLFDQDEMQQGDVLSHADEMSIISLAKQSNVGSLKHAMEIYAEENSLAHGVFENYDVLFPEYELLKKGEPETLMADQSWVTAALSKAHKSPFSRVRTRQADARIAELKAKGYQKKGDQKTNMNQITMIGRTTDPQTIYIKDDMHRDDIIDVTDFSVVDYQWKMMRTVLNETLALAMLIGDGRELDDPDKIHENHVRSIWNDDEIYTIHRDVDIEAARTELQGSNTSANFSENYIYAEAIIRDALYAREKFKGTGTPDFYCEPHLVNVMLLARDLNGRRIYDSKADLARALNVDSIHEIEQFEGKTRTTTDNKVKKLLGLFVNLNDYQFGSTKGGEITKFEDFDMDFNKQKFMLETRLSGALTKVYSAIALEQDVTETVAG